MSTIQPVEWIFVSFMAFIATIINCIILRKELQRRKSEDVMYTTKWLKLFSLLTMLSGVLYTFINFVRYLPVFCQFAAPSSYFLLGNQAIFMGFYQISRIYYCFSQSKVYTKKGYPNYLFIIMYSFGILILINTLYPYFFTLWNTKCGINNKYEYFPKESYIRENPFVAIWANITQSIYIIWDIITLLLYASKVYSFRRYQSDNIVVYNRIMSILKRVLILTACYEIATVLSITIGIIRDALTNEYMLYIYMTTFFFTSVVFNYSMYLMQQHNDEEYNKFLQILYKLRIHYICCCCRSEIEKKSNDTETVMSKDTNNQKPVNCDDTISYTADIPVKDAHSVRQQISVPTILSIHECKD